VERWDPVAVAVVRVARAGTEMLERAAQQARVLPPL